MKENVYKSSIATLTSSSGKFLLQGYEIRSANHYSEAFLIMNEDGIDSNSIVTLRINSACFTSDIFGCLRCDCNWQLKEALKLINKTKNACLIYLMSHEGRGHGVVKKINTFSIMDRDGVTSTNAFKQLNYELDVRNYSDAITILNDKNISKVALVTNNPNKIKVLESENIEVIERIESVCDFNDLRDYLEDKKLTLKHFIKVAK